MSVQSLTDIEIIRSIYHHFGDETQRKKLLEECHEYIESMSFSMEQSEENDSEIADIFIVALQFYLESESVQNHVRFKLKRVLDRIAEGYYLKNPHYRPQ